MKIIIKFFVHIKFLYIAKFLIFNILNTPLVNILYIAIYYIIEMIDLFNIKGYRVFCCKIKVTSYNTVYMHNIYNTIQFSDTSSFRIIYDKKYN